MPESAHDDAEIILAAYSDRVSEAFKIFAENLATGQSEQACVMRFKRGLELIRKARDLALRAATEEAFGQAVEGQKFTVEPTAEPLSAEDQAMVDQALAGTTGHMPAAPPAPRYRIR